MKILQIVDVETWAIGHLAEAIRKYNPQHEWKLLAIHPKALERGEVDLKDFKEALRWC